MSRQFSRLSTAYIDTSAISDGLSLEAIQKVSADLNSFESYMNAELIRHSALELAETSFWKDQQVSYPFYHLDVQIISDGTDTFYFKILVNFHKNGNFKNYTLIGGPAMYSSKNISDITSEIFSECIRKRNRTF